MPMMEAYLDFWCYGFLNAGALDALGQSRLSFAKIESPGPVSQPLDLFSIRPAGTLPNSIRFQLYPTHAARYRDHRCLHVL